MKVVAIDPQEAFAGLEESFASMVTELERTYTAPARDTEAVSLVKSRSTILRYFEEVIEDAEFELSVSVTPALLDRFADSFAAAKERGVSVELVVTPASDAPDPGSYDYEAVATTARARRGITTPIIAVADGNYSVYATQGAVRDDPDRYGVIFNRSALGFLVSGFFGTVIWTTSEPLLEEGAVEPELPRSYASIRRCVKDIRALGGTIYATVEGRDVVSGEFRVVQGEVVSTEFEETEEVASISVQANGSVVDIGGRVAAYEDIEAHEITLDRGSPPDP